MQLPAIRKVTIASTKPVPKGDIVAEVEFADTLNPAQEKYLDTIYRRYADKHGIKLAVNINGRSISFRGFGNRPIPEPTLMAQLLSSMDIDTITPAKPPETRRHPQLQSNVCVKKAGARRPAVTSAIPQSLTA
ncbi:MAG: hypothetical protein KA054_01955 [Candidatus Moranbacteria bacterium]|nr:hypothetical protein [Candidatus Moranbacteria bacterium]